MTGFGALVWLFVRDLVRRRLLWVLAAVTLACVALNFWTVRTVEEAMGNGATWDVATKRAASGLDDLAGTMRAWAVVLVVLVAAQVAPESRRNGTAQFVLSSGVRREVLAAAQFAALALLLAVVTLIIHVGFAIAGIHVGALSVREAALAWPLLFGPLVAVALAAFALSLTASALETYLVFIVVPLVTRALPSLLHSLPRGLPSFVVRAIDNIGLLFPAASDIIVWPHLGLAATGGDPRPELAWPVVHACSATLFWTALGLWFYRHLDLGSRTAAK